MRATCSIIIQSKHHLFWSTPLFGREWTLGIDEIRSWPLTPSLVSSNGQQHQLSSGSPPHFLHLNTAFMYIVCRTKLCLYWAPLLTWSLAKVCQVFRITSNRERWNRLEVFTEMNTSLREVGKFAAFRLLFRRLCSRICNLCWRQIMRYEFTWGLEVWDRSNNTPTTAKARLATMAITICFTRTFILVIPCHSIVQNSWDTFALWH